MDWVKIRLQARAAINEKQAKLNAGIETLWFNLYDACKNAVNTYAAQSRGPEISPHANGQFFIVMTNYTDPGVPEIDRVVVTLNRDGWQIAAERKPARAPCPWKRVLTVDTDPQGMAGLFHDTKAITPNEASQVLLDGMFFPEFEEQG